LDSVYEILASGGYTTVNPVSINYNGTVQNVAADAKGDMFVAMNSAGSEQEILVGAVPFGLVNINNPSSSISLTFDFTGTQTINAPAVLTQGLSGKDFADATTGSCNTNGTSFSYGAGGYCTVNVTLTPQVAGMRSGAVELLDHSGAVLATAYLDGIGYGPQTALYPGTQGALAANAISTNHIDPYGIAVDAANNIYLSNTNSIAGVSVLMVPPTDTACTTLTDCVSLAGNLSPAILEPGGVAVDGAGNIYIADYNARVVEVPPSDQSCSTPGDCVSVGTGLVHPYGLAVDGSGNLYIADGSGFVLQVPPGDRSCSNALDCVHVGTGFTSPRAVAVDPGNNVYITDFKGNFVMKVLATDLTCSNAGDCTDIGPAINAPTGVAVDASGSAYITYQKNGANNLFVRVPATDLTCATATDCTVITGTYTSPYGVALDGSGDIYFTDNNSSVSELNVGTGPTIAFPTATALYDEDTTDGALSTTFANIGTASLSILQPAAGTMNPKYPNSFAYDVTLSTCPQLSSSSSAYSVNAGATCIYGADFIPAAAGANSGPLAVTDNNLGVNGTHNVASFSGTGLAATPTLSFVPAPNSQVYGTAITAGSLDATATYNSATVAGSFVYTTTISSVPNSTVTAGTTILPVGIYTITATFTPTDTVDFKSTSTTATYTVNQITPTLTYVPAPTTQVYGTAIAAGSLDATATYNSVAVPGSFAYTTTISSVPNSTVTAGTTILPVANYTIKATFTPTDTVDYASTSTTASYSVTLVTPTLTFVPSPVTQVYGTAIAAGSLDATATYNSVTVPGTFAYTTTISSVPNSTVTAGTTILPTANYTIKATFTPTDTVDYGTVSTTASYSVTQATPVLAYVPVPITQVYGTAISSGALDATATFNSASVSGNFAYTTTISSVPNSAVTAGTTILPVANYTIKATFTPTDTVNYASTSTTASYSVTQATPVLAYVPTPATQVYGTAITTGALDATATFNSATVPGSFAYTTTISAVPGSTVTGGTTILPVANYTITATFTPTDAVDYKSTTTTASYSVTQATPVLAYVPAPATQVYGAAITTASLDATATYNSVTVPGSFAYTTTISAVPGSTVTGGTTILPVANYTITATFTPTDTVDYKTTSTTAAYTVTQATPVLAYTPAPNTQIYGTAIGTTSLNATATYNSATVPGSFVYTTTINAVPGSVVTGGTTILPVSAYTITATFTPTDTVDYKTTSTTATYTVTQATPVLNYAPLPNTQVYGTAVAAGSLDATATFNSVTVPGNFAYTTTISAVPGSTVTAGTTVLPVAVYTITATFTPTDTVDYKSTSTTTTYSVTQATPVMTYVPLPATQVYGTAITTASLDATATYNSIAVPGTIAYTTTINSVAGSTVTGGTTILPVAVYTITATFTPTDTVDYKSTSTTAAYSVTQATPVLAYVPSPNAQSYGTAITAGSLDATATFNSIAVPGSFAYTTTISAVPGSAVTAGTTILPVAVYTITATFTPTDTVDYKTTTTTATYTVTTLTPVIGITSSANPVYVQNAILFTATVTAPPVIVPGTVNFLDGTTVIGTGTLNNGVATLLISTLTSGAHSITATYVPPNANYGTVTTASPIAEVVDDFTLSTSITAGVIVGSGNVLTFTITPENSTTFPAAVTLSLSGLPTGATYTITPGAVIAAGSGAQTVTINIKIPASSAALHSPQIGPRNAGYLALALLLLPFAGRLRRYSKSLGRLLCILLLLFASLASVFGISGCGTTQQKIYTVLITATSGTLTHVTTITLAVDE